MIGVRSIKDRDALRQHLDELNDEGTNTVAVGVDSRNQPFLIALVGPYAEREEVFFDSPWQREHDHGGVPARCEDCDAHSHVIGDIHFPAYVMVYS